MQITPVTLKQGILTRYYARTIGGSIMATDEVLEDTKYPEVIKAAARLSAALYLTVDVDCTNLLARAQNANYTFGDGVSLACAAHTLADGGTWSNQMTVPLPPSVLACSTARTAVTKYPGHNGWPGFGGIMLDGVAFPVDQQSVWETLVGSKMTPTAGNFAEMNVVPGMKLKTVPIRWWNNTTTNYCFLTDAKNGVQHRWKRKPRSMSWVTDGNQTMVWAITARYTTGCSDARSVFFVGA
jgi:hypothetical protein